MDWKLCCICQLKTNEDPKRPYLKKQYHASYNAVELMISNLGACGSMVAGNVDLCHFNDGRGIAATLLDKKAIFHHSCRERLRKGVKGISTTQVAEQTSEPLSKRQRNRSEYDSKNSICDTKCVYCQINGDSESLFKAVSFNCGKNLASWAKFLNFSFQCTF